jgi:hypothetical protein
MNEQKNDPVWKPNELEPNKEIIVTLESAKPVASGSGIYGEWELWVVNVENAVVFDKNTKKKIENYTGKAVCFPSNKLMEAFHEYTNGTRENTKIGVTKTFGENLKKQPFTKFETRIIENGTTPSSNLIDLHYQFLNAFKEMVKRNIMDNSLNTFINFAKTDTWNITDQTIIDKIWKVYQEQN